MTPNIDTSTFIEFSVREAGREACIAGKEIHFTPKDYAIIHYVYSGQGQFTYRGKTHSLRPGDCFYIAPRDEATYVASSSDPWSYFWIGLGGGRCPSLLEYAGLSRENPIRHDKGRGFRKYFEAIYESYFDNGSFGIDCLSYAYGLLFEMGRGENKVLRSGEKGHIQAAKAFIRNNYQFPITIVDVARSVGVSPNYLANLFASEGETSPKRYLTDVRMEVAATMLLSGGEPIAAISRSVGYPNPLHFSKAFTAYHGVSPLHYRQQGGISQ